MNRIVTLLVLSIIYNGLSFGQESTKNNSGLNSNLEDLYFTQEILRSRISILKDSMSIISKKISDEEIRLFKLNKKKLTTMTISKGALRDDPSPVGNELLQVPQNSEIVLVAYHGNNYWKVMHNEIIGFVNGVFLVNSKEMREVKQNFEKDALEMRKTESREFLDYLRQKCIEEYGEDICNRIEKGEIWIGMNDWMTRQSIGHPERTNRTTSSYGTSEQWVYPNRYLYFENGKLKSWQSTY